MRPKLMAPDPGPGGAPAAAPPAAAPPAAAPPAAAPPAAAPAAAPPASAPPAGEYAYLTDSQRAKFIKDGKLSAEELARAHAAAESLVGRKREEIAAEVKTELRQGVPATADAYVAAPPPGVAIPEGGKWEWDANDPLMKSWREICHKAGASQEIFQEGLNAFAARELAMLPNITAEMAKLGDRSKERVDRVTGWLQGELGAHPDLYDELYSSITTAKGIEALEALMTRVNPQLALGGDRLPSGGPTGQAITWERIDAMMADPRYRGHQKDAGFIDNVQELVKQGMAKGTLKRRAAG